MKAPEFALELAADQCLRIVDDAGCALRVVEGRIWVTIDGTSRDVIAGAGDRLVLERLDRAMISALNDATIAITARCRIREVGFVLREIDGSRILTVSTPTADTLGQFSRWLFAGGAPASRPVHSVTPLA